MRPEQLAIIQALRQYGLTAQPSSTQTYEPYDPSYVYSSGETGAPSDGSEFEEYREEQSYYSPQQPYREESYYGNERSFYPSQRPQPAYPRSAPMQQGSGYYPQGVQPTAGYGQRLGASPSELSSVYLQHMQAQERERRTQQELERLRAEREQRSSKIAEQTRLLQRLREIQSMRKKKRRKAMREFRAELARMGTTPGAIQGFSGVPGAPGVDPDLLALLTEE